MGLIEALKAQGAVRNLQQHGTSWSASNCPQCGERSETDGDRLCIWPAQRDGRGRFWCRKCGINGDGIDLLRAYDPAMTYADARLAVTGRLPPDNWAIAGKPKPVLDFVALAKRTMNRRSQRPALTPLPPDAWMAEATAVWVRARELLRTDKAARAYLGCRGLDPDSAWASAALGWLSCPTRLAGQWLPPGVLQATLDATSGLVVGASVHTRDPHLCGGQKHVWARGVRARSVVFRPKWRPRLALVMESVLDAALAWQELPGVLTVGVGSGAWNPDHDADEAICAVERVVFVPDLDDTGREAVKRWRRRWPQADVWEPVKGKDLGEMHTAAMAGVEGAMTVQEWSRHHCPATSFPHPTVP